MANTRRILECVPEDRFSWKPHENPARWAVWLTIWPRCRAWRRRQSSARVRECRTRIQRPDMTLLALMRGRVMNHMSTIAGNSASTCAYSTCRYPECTVPQLTRSSSGPDRLPGSVRRLNPAPQKTLGACAFDSGADPLIRAGPPGPALLKTDSCEEADEGVGCGSEDPPHQARWQRLQATLSRIRLRLFSR